MAKSEIPSTVKRFGMGDQVGDITPHAKIGTHRGVILLSQCRVAVDGSGVDRRATYSVLQSHLQ